MTSAREELLHYDALVGFGGVPLTKRIWVPRKVFQNRTNLLSTQIRLVGGTPPNPTRAS